MPPVDVGTLDAELSGLDALEMAGVSSLSSRARRAWDGTWPKLAAAGLAIGLWQLAAWSNWRPDYVLPGPGAVLGRVVTGFARDGFLDSVGVTMSRGAVGFALAAAIGTLGGAAVARVRLLRAAVGSLITGLQTMPSIAWFPLAILLFKISEGAILFVVVLGAAPAVANGLIAGIDQIPPILLRAGRVMGARGFSAYRHIVFPAALPAYVAGLKQGWAFAWRSLLAGELLVIIGTRPSLGVRLQFARELADAELLMALMIVVLVVGILVDALVFGTVERALRQRRGLIE